MRAAGLRDGIGLGRLRRAGANEGNRRQPQKPDLQAGVANITGSLHILQMLFRTPGTQFTGLVPVARDRRRGVRSATGIDLRIGVAAGRPM